MKKFIFGFVTGGILTAAITGFAVEYAITANPYPVRVNGVETAIQGYNINDATYFKLRDVADAVGGFNVDFKDNEIILETKTAPKPTSTPLPAAKANLAPLPEVKIEVVDGEKYVRKSNIEKMLNNIGLGKYHFSVTYFFDDTLDDGSTILTNIPHHPTNDELIPVDYYNSTVVPVIQALR